MARWGLVFTPCGSSPAVSTAGWDTLILMSNWYEALKTNNSVGGTELRGIRTGSPVYFLAAAPAARFSLVLTFRRSRCLRCFFQASRVFLFIYGSLCGSMLAAVRADDEGFNVGRRIDKDTDFSPNEQKRSIPQHTPWHSISLHGVPFRQPKKIHHMGCFVV